MKRCLLSGSSNPSLVEELSRLSKITLTERQISTFPNQEFRIKVAACEPITYLVQSFSQPVNDHLIEFLLLADAAKRHGSRFITAILPWFGYSKQDKVFQPGEPLSAKVVARLVQLSQVEKLVTIDLHNPSITGYFDIPVINLQAMPLFVKNLKNALSKDSVVVSPDAGSIKNSTKFADALNLDIAHLNKKRDLDTGEVTVVGLNKEIESKNVVIIDDMIATGDTLIKTSQYLKAKGAGTITVCATHHLYINGVQEKLIEAPIDRLIVTNSIAMPENCPTQKLTQLSIAPLLAEAIE